MSFNFNKDYFGLSQGVLSSLDQILHPPTCRAGSNTFGVSDPLDKIRCNVDSDFARNGVEVALDEVDIFQSRLRVPTDSGSNLNSSQAFQKQQSRRKKKLCVFCRNNGESAPVYQSHVLKDEEGRTTCPILRRYTCPTCGASGDKAHTIRYCPLYHGGLASLRDPCAVGTAGRPKMNRSTTPMLAEHTSSARAGCSGWYTLPEMTPLNFSAQARQTSEN